jgi:hypothetical protein
MYNFYSDDRQHSRKTPAGRCWTPAVNLEHAALCTISIDVLPITYTQK